MVRHRSITTTRQALLSSPMAKNKNESSHRVISKQILNTLIKSIQRRVNICLLASRTDKTVSIIFCCLVAVVVLGVFYSSNNGVTNEFQEKETMSTGKRPVLILHVGPPKTGSTSLQCTLERLRDELEKDGIAYIGRPECPGIDIEYGHKKKFRLFSTALVTGIDCQRQLIERGEQLTRNATMERIPSCWRDFFKEVSSYRDAGTNVIFSDEAMSNRVARTVMYGPNQPYPFQIVKSILEDNLGWDVRILMVHRPLYDYLPSVYADLYKEGPNKVRLRKWYGGGSSPSCPSQGGRAIPRPFDIHIPITELSIARLLKPDQNLYPTPAQVYELFQDHGFVVTLIDMMGTFFSADGTEFNFILHIICNKMPGTVATCQALRNKNKNDEGQNQKLNSSPSLHYDFIAVEACQKGLFDGTIISRDVVRRAIQRQQEQEWRLSPNDLPLTCPPDAILHDLLRVSQDHERRLGNAGKSGTSEGIMGLSQNWRPDEESRHEERFWKMVHDKKFCTVNSTRVVTDEKWIAFFSQLANGK